MAEQDFFWKLDFSRDTIQLPISSLIVEEISSEPFDFPTMEILTHLASKGVEKISVQQLNDIKESILKPSYDMPEIGFVLPVCEIAMVTLVVASVFNEPDWGLTFYAWSQGDFSYYDLVGLLPLVSNQVARAVGKGLEAGIDMMRRSDNLGGAFGYVDNIFRRGACFVAGTLVITDAGYKEIDKIQPGDLVLSKDEVSGKVGYKPVVRTFVRTVDSLLVVILENGEAIETTKEHPFWAEGFGWVHAEYLMTDSILLMADGTYVEIESVELVEVGEEVTVYNFEVQDYHTYFVGSGVWVHNSCDVIGNLKLRNGHLAEGVHPVSNVLFDKNGFPIFDAVYETTLSS